METTNQSSLPEHPFWTFSLQLYQQPEVEEALLLLQRRFGLNANLILYFCWYAFNSQGGFSQAKVRKLLMAIRPWHDRVVLPLRRIRDRLKPYIDRLPWVERTRNAVLQEELMAEHAEQLMIAENTIFEQKRVKSPPQKAADICRSLNSYCRVMRTDLDQEGCAATANLLSIMFSKMPTMELEKLSRKRLLRRRRMGTQLWLDI